MFLGVYACSCFMLAYEACVCILHVCACLVVYRNPNLGFLLLSLFASFLITYLASVSFVFTCLGLGSIEYHVLLLGLLD